MEADLTKTDLTFVAGGIACGILLGLVILRINGIALGLGTAARLHVYHLTDH
jgi:uncharacterized transporter YbjL